MNTNQLAYIANETRIDIIRMISNAGSGHPGGSLSCADILTVLFFSGQMKYDTNDPNDHSFDRFILSKGHAAPALYAVYHQLGWISDNELITFRRMGSRLQGHPDAKFLPPVEVCSGSLGQGLSIGSGLALALKKKCDGKANEQKRVYVLCGDGELQEGSNWEAMMFSAHQRIDNLTLLIDLNQLQIDGFVDDVCSLGNLKEKLLSFGWLVREVDGHSITEIERALVWANVFVGAPHAIIFHTVKGKGISFMENQRVWHGKAPSVEERDIAMKELFLHRNMLLAR